MPLAALFPPRWRVLRFAPVLCRRVFLMYVTSLLLQYIRTLYPTIRASSLRRLLALSGWGEAFINGHVADQRLVFSGSHYFTTVSSQVQRPYKRLRSSCLSYRLPINSASRKTPRSAETAWKVISANVVTNFGSWVRWVLSKVPQKGPKIWPPGRCAELR